MDIKKKILVLEDEEMLLESYAESLAKVGYEVLKANDGNKAWDLLESNGNELSLMVLDLVVPGLDGLEFLRLVKDRGQKYASIPVLVLTNMTSDAVIKEAFDLGATSYLIKNDMTVQCLEDEVKKIIG